MGDRVDCEFGVDPGTHAGGCPGPLREFSQALATSVELAEEAFDRAALGQQRPAERPWALEQGDAAKFNSSTSLIPADLPV